MHDFGANYYKMAKIKRFLKAFSIFFISKGIF